MLHALVVEEVIEPAMTNPFSLPSLSGGKLNRFALYLSLAYLVICALYIVISGELALNVARSPEELATIERYKGLAFIVFSSLLFYVIARILVRRILQQEHELMVQRRALLESEMRAAAGIMAASVAHDIKNVLTLFNFQLYLLDREMTAAERREKSATSTSGSASPPGAQPVIEPRPQTEIDAPSSRLEIDRVETIRQLGVGVEQLNGLAKRLLAVSRSDVGEPAQYLDLAQIVQEDVDFMRLHKTVRSCKLEISRLEAISMYLHRGLIDQMILNLLLNAAEAIGGQGHIEVCVFRDKSSAVLEVHDDGKAAQETLFSDAKAAALFEAFYTTKAAGHGLGLYTVKACVEIHAGKVEVERSHLGGACFRVRLPVATVSG